ncbi:MAG: outer membrane protein OmpA-like peptidoglycan-associated protein [Myxococcota bacterium]
MAGVVAMPLLLNPAEAQAQAQSNVGNINVQNFYVAGGRYRIWSVEGSQVAPAWELYGSLLASYERESLKYDFGGTQPEVLVDNAAYLDLNLGVGLADWAQVELALPVALAMTSANDTQSIAPITEGAGIGDLILRVRGSLLRNRAGGWGVGLTLGASFPTGDGDKFRSDEGVNVLANLIVDLRTSKVLVALNVGARIRTADAEFLGRTFGNELTYGLGVDVSVWRNWVDLSAELFGKTPLDAPFNSVEDTAMEFLLGTKVWVMEGLALQAAVGGGLIQGYGTPDFRFVGGAVWAPRPDDTDGDGIQDRDDWCPQEPEDLDGFSDRDGCPEPDNDQDGLDDSVDKCPNDPEDVNGIDDHDGCPDGDQDGDGIADAKDRCPNEREDIDQWRDQDGCPDPDNDNDGIQDGADNCPNKPETRNGFEDEDGCPDKTPTTKTKPTEPHVVPKAQPSLKKDLPETDPCRLIITQMVFFEKGSNVINKGGQVALAEVANKLRERRDISEISIEGHTHDEGSALDQLTLSKKRAEVVQAYLGSKGISTRIMAARGLGDTAPIGAKERAGEPNRRVEFVVKLGGDCAARN